jgi:multicomponent Na+:H+ antiporter subunit E
MIKAILTLLSLAILWVLMSGLFKPLLLILGAVSILITYFFMRRMNKIEDEPITIALKPFKFLGYCIWLLKEIALANWAVTKVILSPRMPIRQNLFSIPHSQQGDMASTIFANSITLTPGTITVETEPGYFLVHALSFSEDDLDALADMDGHVAAIEDQRYFKTPSYQSTHEKVED